MRAVEDAVLAGNLQQRIPLNQCYFGTRTLARKMNQEFSNLEHNFDYQRQFTEDAAHELRTPVAAMRLKPEIALRRERDAATYRKALVDCQSNLQHLSECAEHLLDLSRLDRGEQAEWQSCDLKALVEAALETMDSVIQDRGVTSNSICIPPAHADT